LGSIEQHGPHLPCGTDTFLVNEFVKRAVDLLPSELPACVCPTVEYSVVQWASPMASAGIQPFTLEQSLVDICHALTDLGFEKILMVHGHGGISSGQSALWQALQEKRPALYVDFMPYTACREQIQALGGPFAAHAKRPDPQYPSLSGPGIYAVPSLNASQQGVYLGHAGYMETSMMLAVRPDLVDTSQMIRVIEVPKNGTARADMIRFGDACLNLLAETTARIIRDLASAPVPDQWRSIHSLLPVSSEE
jgi:creatinine amidohydrolase/Fe(II)-dependent formamide hydrolase-like protein